MADNPTELTNDQLASLITPVICAQYEIVRRSKNAMMLFRSSAQSEANKRGFSQLATLCDSSEYAILLLEYDGRLLHFYGDMEKLSDAELRSIVAETKEKI